MKGEEEEIAKAEEAKMEEMMMEAKMEEMAAAEEWAQCAWTKQIENTKNWIRTDHSALVKFIIKLIMEVAKLNESHSLL